ncbi:MAG: DNA/RNA nuclease SfsA, partial [Thermofilaceae archaeon]
MLLDLPPAVEGRIIRRVNRFVVEVVVGGLVERAYINNTGRLSELL